MKKKVKSPKRVQGKKSCKISLTKEQLEIIKKLKAKNPGKRINCYLSLDAQELTFSVGEPASIMGAKTTDEITVGILFPNRK